MQDIASIMSVWGRDLRVRLVNALNGDFYAIPEVGRDDNWTVPLRAFAEVQDLRGKYLWKLEPVPGNHGQQGSSSCRLGWRRMLLWSFDT